MHFTKGTILIDNQVLKSRNESSKLYLITLVMVRGDGSTTYKNINIFSGAQKVRTTLNNVIQRLETLNIPVIRFVCDHALEFPNGPIRNIQRTSCLWHTIGLILRRISPFAMNYTFLHNSNQANQIIVNPTAIWIATINNQFWPNNLILAVSTYAIFFYMGGITDSKKENWR